MIGLPWTSSGRNGAGGAVVRLTARESSSGAPAAAARKPRSTFRPLRPRRRPGRRRPSGRPRACELERGDDAEVAAAAAQRPEQLRVLVLAGVQVLAVGGHDVGADEVVAGQAALADQPADAAAEREPGDAGGRHQSPGDRQPERLRLGVDVAPQAAGLRRDRAPVRVDADPRSSRRGRARGRRPPWRSRGCCGRRRVPRSACPRSGRTPLPAAHRRHRAQRMTRAGLRSCAPFQIERASS